ncbi:extensin [Brevundimonas sp. LM2]|uniref:extensin family protein n=1 Tax=Brevundimonas sp. LM2 TaxID=1938605 RepID=UPI000983CA52|nr:extensin family protein [Brevundimonas sp. LM2]AQR62837.1 extensin [Brevundimonas sp. LM2]
MRILTLLAVSLLLSGCGRLIPDAPGNGPRPYAPAPGAAGPRAAVASGGGVIDAPIEGGTFARLGRATASLGQCVAELDAARVTFSPTPDRVNSETCGLTDAGVLGADYGTTARMAPSDVTMTCALAAAVSVWRRQSVEPAAREILGSDVVQIDHMGVYACRGVRTDAGSTARASAHSRAAALDFSGVRLRDGRRITVTRDWAGDTPEARFLRRIRDEGCQVFGTVLSPDYNAVHFDHLHLEAERGRLCR